jgi:hypothetical protein
MRFGCFLPKTPVCTATQFRGAVHTSSCPLGEAGRGLRFGRFLPKTDIGTQNLSQNCRKVKFT